MESESIYSSRITESQNKWLLLDALQYNVSNTALRWCQKNLHFFPIMKWIMGS